LPAGLTWLGGGIGDVEGFQYEELAIPPLVHVGER
jgi:hypothetical protein